MCGIVGVYDMAARALEPVVRRSNERLVHRGPDGQGLGCWDGAVLAMRRLAIIDLETGDQPMSNERSDVHAVVNGEIYNYVELMAEQRAAGHHFRSRSDVETVVHAYEDDPVGWVERLRGMFAIALYDQRNDRLLLARDWFGQKPLYYARLPSGGVAFASEMKALLPILEHAGVRPTIDDQAVADFLSLGVVPQPHTIYREVSSLLPGERLYADRTGVRKEQYWRPTLLPTDSIAYDDALEIVRSEIADAVRICLRSDVSIGAFLSGGLDSTVVVYEAVQAGARDLVTYTVEMNDQRLDESGVAARTATAFGLENIRVPARLDPIGDLFAVIRQFDQPFADGSALATFGVARAMAGSRKVVLTGDGGDEVLGGYVRHLAAFLASRLPDRPTRVLAGAAAPLLAGLSRLSDGRKGRLAHLERFVQGLALNGAARLMKWSPDLLRDSDRHVFLGHRRRSTEAFADELIAPYTRPIEQQLAFDQRLILPSDLLVKMDMATSAWSLEARAPLLDHVFATRMLQLPREHLFRGGRTKALLRDAYAGRIPAEVSVGKKRGFELPLHVWLKSDWQPLIHELLLRPDARVTRFVDRAFVKELFSGRSYRDRHLYYLQYALLVLELWLSER